MASTIKRVQNVVKIKKGEHVILPPDAQIISITEVDGAQAESLCDLPDPTPLVKYTFFFDRRAEGSGTDHYIGIQSFHLGNQSITYTDPFPHQDSQFGLNGAFIQGLKNFPGVAALYYCWDDAGSGRNNQISMDVPSSLAAPYFTMFSDDSSMDYWLFRVDPIDTSNPIQVDRGSCPTRVI